jgi:hypothetical protein
MGRINYGQARTTKKLFSRQTIVAIEIAAPAEMNWKHWRAAFSAARMIPPFDESFNQFAQDLKSAAEESA